MHYQNIVAITNRKICYDSLYSLRMSDWCHGTYLSTDALSDMVSNISPNEQNSCAALLGQIARLAQTKLIHIVLREKDLSSADYKQLSIAATKICEFYNKKLILHNFFSVATELSHPHIHLPLHILENIQQNHLFTDKSDAYDSVSLNDSFDTIGVSVHSKDEAIRAETLGATYLIAGHIFDTECKKGLPGRGLSFLHDVCNSVTIPVYAIGGITPDNLSSIIDAGATGGCMMSGLMKVGAKKLLTI